MKNLKNSLTARGDAQASDDPSGIICASFREGAPTLVIITWEGKRWVMPWIHFQYAWHEDQEEFELMKLYYSTHEVSLEGVRLERLVEHFAKFGVEWIRSYDKRYLQLCPQELPFIENIHIEEKEE